ncbi:glycosyltransferase [Reinekea blandensis]|uniref:Putative lipopolysaccharide biosynthesis glycosyl transferase n=1 Tax=Reinekea blandensis MED297 TaxID=314283 RepID=A4BIZ1_9GAMM|nr:glycosyltransferase [Reinekea blandensis]EAR07924.1 putative lipopolysaccharide biosynthesis glycosyl transferase [Reinekea sp. MED297] [Reinekea blandensis MED297]
MTIFVSVISHDHYQDITQLLKPHTFHNGDDIVVVMKDNQHCPKLRTYCRKHSIDCLTNSEPKGFGENNNDIYLYCRLKHNMKDDDLFVVLNPDVIVEKDVFLQLNQIMKEKQVRLAAPNLFRDEQMKILEGSIRRYPMPWDFVSSFILNSQRTTIKRHHITEPSTVDWASGAFLAFRACLYKELAGFDPRYYLYCEDIDICWRARVCFNEPTYYIPHIKAIHRGHRHSHSVVSSYIRWHITSAMKFSSRFVAWRLFGLSPKPPKSHTELP